MLNVIKMRKVTLGLSLLLVIASIVLFFVRGLNLDVDFTGGTTVYVNIGQKFNNDDISAIVKEAIGVDASTVQKSGDTEQEVVIKVRSLSTEERAKLFDAIAEKYDLNDDALLQVDNVDATVGKELSRSAIISSVIAIVLMLLYISVRFEFFSGLAAIYSLAQNVIILVGIYSLFQLPVNTTFIAAILTILGYSINDTIVIFDRIRENDRIMKKTPFSEVSNVSVKQSVTRSINTSVTTLITIVVLFILGVSSIRQFALPIIIGVAIGTFSSLFIATPVWWMIRGDGKNVVKAKK